MHYYFFVASPTASQKNDMLLSIVLEHLIPHTESLMTVVASSAANKTINIKFEIMARVSDIQGSTVPNQRKIVLSLQKKFKSQTSAMEVLIDKDVDKTINFLSNNNETAWKVGKVIKNNGREKVQFK